MSLAQSFARERVLAAARRQGFVPYLHASSMTWQICGHRWDRWAALRRAPEPLGIVYIVTKYAPSRWGTTHYMETPVYAN